MSIKIKQNNQDLGVVIPYFNLGFRSYKNNLLQNIKNGTLSKIKGRFIVVECAFNNNAFEKWPSGVEVIQLRSNSRVWQKEALINVGIKYLISLGYDYVGYLDGDTEILEDHWYYTALHKLQSNKYDFLQLFSSIYINRRCEYNGWEQFYGAVEYFKLGNPVDRCYCNGGGWVITAKAYKKLGRLVDDCLLGANDTIIWFAIHSDNTTIQSLKDRFNYDGDYKIIKKYKNLRYDNIDATALCRPHGSYEKRSYGTRESNLKGFENHMIYYNSDGLIEWSPQACPKIKKYINTYFSNRDDDQFSQKYYDNLTDVIIKGKNAVLPSNKKIASDLIIIIPVDIDKKNHGRFLALEYVLGTLDIDNLNVHLSISSRTQFDIPKNISSNIVDIDDINKSKLVNEGIRCVGKKYKWIFQLDADIIINDINEILDAVKKSDKRLILPWRQFERLGFINTNNFLNNQEYKIDDTTYSESTGAGGLIYSYELWAEVGGYDENYKNWGGEDEDFFCKCKQKTDYFLREDLPTAVHIYHENSRIFTNFEQVKSIMPYIDNEYNDIIRGAIYETKYKFIIFCDNKDYQFKIYQLLNDHPDIHIICDDSLSVAKIKKIESNISQYIEKNIGVVTIRNKNYNKIIDYINNLRKWCYITVGDNMLPIDNFIRNYNRIFSFLSLAPIYNHDENISLLCHGRTGSNALMSAIYTNAIKHDRDKTILWEPTNSALNKNNNIDNSTIISRISNTNFIKHCFVQYNTIGEHSVRDIEKKIIDNADRVIFIKRDFYNWFYSFYLAKSQERWIGSEYEPTPIPIREVKNVYKQWLKRNNDYNHMHWYAQKHNKKIHNYTYNDIMYNKYFINIDLGLRMGDWTIKKQARHPWSYYVSNYVDVDNEIKKYYDT